MYVINHVAKKAVDLRGFKYTDPMLRFNKLKLNLGAQLRRMGYT